jgi:hypothetical protein
MNALPQPPAELQWVSFTDGPVAFLAPAGFGTHREDDDTVAVYPPGDSGITLRFSLHTRPLQPEMPADVAEQFVSEHATSRGLSLTRLHDRVYLTESRETDWPDRRVLVHHWQIGCGRILVVGSATIWGSDRESPTIQQTLSVVPKIIESLRLT